MSAKRKQNIVAVESSVLWIAIESDVKGKNTHEEKPISSANISA